MKMLLTNMNLSKFLILLNSITVGGLIKSKHGVSSVENFSFRKASSVENCEANSLGMESGRITDEQLSASSSFDALSVGPQSSRIRREIEAGAWCPREQIHDTSYEYLQINLLEAYRIIAVETQGRYGNGAGREFTEYLIIDYSFDVKGNNWTRHRQNGTDHILHANWDTKTPVLRELEPAIIASRVRLVPYSTQLVTVCLRAELYGCKVPSPIACCLLICILVVLAGLRLLSKSGSRSDESKKASIDWFPTSPKLGTTSKSVLSNAQLFCYDEPGEDFATLAEKFSTASTTIPSCHTSESPPSTNPTLLETVRRTSITRCNLRSMTPPQLTYASSVITCHVPRVKPIPKPRSMRDFGTQINGTMEKGKHIPRILERPPPLIVGSVQ